MATLTIKQARKYRDAPDGIADIAGGAEMPGYNEDASQTYLVGDPVTFDATSGEVKIQADGDNVLGLCARALKKASGTTGDDVLIEFFRPGQQFIMNYEASGAASASALTIIGDEVEFNIASGKLMCDKNGAGGKDKISGVIRDCYATDNGYPSADGVMADTPAQVIVELLPGNWYRISA